MEACLAAAMLLAVSQWKPRIDSCEITKILDSLHLRLMAGLNISHFTSFYISYNIKGRRTCH